VEITLRELDAAVNNGQLVFASQADGGG
jgi:hypothetical protein